MRRRNGYRAMKKRWKRKWERRLARGKRFLDSHDWLLYRQLLGDREDVLRRILSSYTDEGP